MLTLRTSIGHGDGSIQSNSSIEWSGKTGQINIDDAIIRMNSSFKVEPICLRVRCIESSPQANGHPQWPEWIGLPFIGHSNPKWNFFRSRLSSTFHTHLPRLHISFFVRPMQQCSASTFWLCWRANGPPIWICGLFGWIGTAKAK